MFISLQANPSLSEVLTQEPHWGLIGFLLLCVAFLLGAYVDSFHEEAIQKKAKELSDENRKTR